jgi:catechol 2,3-dioxygenase-like lactoylglutathione lyase family enzyme
MLDTAKVISFVATTSPEDSRRFYEGVLGLRLIADEPTALVFDSNGTMLRVSKLSRFAPAPFTVLGWEVEDIMKTVDELNERGVSMERFEGFAQDDKGILTFPDGTLVSWFKDPEGNLLSLTQFRR